MWSSWEKAIVNFFFAESALFQFTSQITYQITYIRNKVKIQRGVTRSFVNRKTFFRQLDWIIVAHSISEENNITLTGKIVWWQAVLVALIDMMRSRDPKKNKTQTHIQTQDLEKPHKLQILPL